MATVFPLRAYRPKPEHAARIAAVPYDVVDRDEARALAKGNPLSFLHVTKPEIDLADDTDPYGNSVYAKGRAALDELVKSGALVQDTKPCFYVYELTMGRHSQTGIVLCASVADYDQNIVKKHEHTRPDKENDRVRHIEATTAHTGKVFLVHRSSAALAAEVAAATRGAPVYDFTAADAIRHRLWVIDEPQRIETIVRGFADLGPIYIADGHHRSAAASRVAKERGGKGASARFLCVSFPESEVQILPYNRLVKDLSSRSPESFLEAVRARFDVTEGKPEPTAPKRFGMYLGGTWYTLTARQGSYDPKHPVGRLDVSILQDQLLSPLLGISDPRRDKRIDFVGGIRGDAELERRVAAGWAVAFKMHPTAIADLFAIADAEQVMPPKSTWFEPKLRDGLVVHRIE
jgi:uncharacterized protein (DUF1015 family)